ncbi:MAG: transcription-repair coupling factor [Bacillota bacterium]
MNSGYIIRRIQESQQFLEAVKELGSGAGKVNMSGLSGSRSSFWAAALADKGFPIVMVCSSEARAREVLEDLKSLTGNVYYYPPLQPVLYNDMVHSMEAEWERISTLDAMASGNAGMVVATVEALLFPVMPSDRYKKTTLIFNIGEEPGMDKILERLVFAGYKREHITEGPGQFSVRGGILDIFPVGSLSPCRIEFFGDMVDSIRVLDADSQRSVEKVEGIRIPPCRELLTVPEEREEILRNMDADLKETVKGLKASGLGDRAEELKEDIAGVKVAIEAVPGTRLISNYWMYGCKAVSPIDYMGRDHLVVLDNPARVKEEAERFHEGFIDHYSDRLEKGKVLNRQQHRILTPEQLQLKLDKTRVVNITDILKGQGVLCSFSTRGMESFHGKLPLAVKEIARLKKEGYVVGILVGSSSRLGTLQEELIKNDIFSALAEVNADRDFPAGTVVLGKGTVKEGFLFPGAKLAVFSDGDIFGTTKKRLKAVSKAKKKGIETFTELRPGDYVVHENQGIGIYKGIQELKVEGIKRDYLQIEYRNGDMLYLPTYQSHLIQKYVGAEGKRVRVSRMGGREWTKTKAGVKRAIEGMARELLQLYAAREAAEGYAFGEDTVWQKQFDDLFPFEETPGQLRCIEETKKDMERPRPMDRLLCGDVGYGKTEVAMRAAFKVVMDGKQVAMLVPTTILAQQHYNTFRQRMEQFPVNIEMISRFRTAGQQQEILMLLKEGNIDILIGTHRLLQQDVVFKDLGLLVVDEEQRFGVCHKEAIKRLKGNIDVLTLTATPIPRTLHMSMAGVRDMSVILDPPRDRFPVETFIVEQSDRLIRDAIQRELGRNGQVYFVHNRVHSIEKMARELRTLVPGASIGTAHGQMDERVLERVMMDFLGRKYDILLCTTIIENGLDMPNVNTIIVTDSDRLGLSQMYQLKGRVGRSNRIAYAYFTYRKDKVLTEAAEKRLKAIKEFTEFGAGFKIALRDLEIRGAGNILGHEQHGHMMTVGYDLYCKLLDQTVKELKGLPVEQRVETQLDLKADAYIPDFYIPDEKQKVEIYRRIASIETFDDYLDVYDELCDRFGEPAGPVTNLLLISHIKSQCQRLGIQAVVQKEGIIKVEFAEKAPVEPKAIAAFLNEYAGRVKFKASKALSFTFRTNTEDSYRLLILIKGVLEKIICFNNG